jgi:hypothetical protein
VYDYDWGMRDDFIGEASVDLRKLPLNLAQDLLLSLCDSGQRLLQYYINNKELKPKYDPEFFSGGLIEKHVMRWRVL